MASESMKLSQYWVAFLHTIPRSSDSARSSGGRGGLATGCCPGCGGNPSVDDSSPPQRSLRFESLFRRGCMDDDGPFFEDFRVGTEMRSKVGRTVTETDNVWFTLLTGNGNQIHFNED